MLDGMWQGEGKGCRVPVGEMMCPSLRLQTQASSVRLFSRSISLALKEHLISDRELPLEEAAAQRTQLNRTGPQFGGILPAQPEGSLLSCQTHLPARLGGEDACSAVRHELTFRDLSRTCCATLERKALPSRLTASNAIFLFEECKSSHFYPKAREPGYTF